MARTTKGLFPMAPTDQTPASDSGGGSELGRLTRTTSTKENGCYKDTEPWFKGLRVEVLRDNRLADGVKAFNETLNSFHKNNELWVTYETPKKIEKAEDIPSDDVEMFMSVVTIKDAPMESHWGISRSFGYLLGALKYAYEKRRYELASESPRTGMTFQKENAFPLHSKLAMKLHSFSARVMLSREPNKLYMINAPLNEMRETARKALPKNTYMAHLDKKAKKLYLKNKEIHEDSIELREIKKEQQSIRDEIVALSNEEKAIFEKKQLRS